MKSMRPKKHNRPKGVIIMAKKNKYENLTEEEIIEIKHQKKKKRQSIFDKITTGILIFLMASPVLILGYIFLWFIISLQK